MLKPLLMKKVRMIGMLDVQSMALSLWRRLGVLQIELTDSKYYSGLEQSKPQDRYDDVSNALVNIRAIKNALKPVDTEPKSITTDPVKLAESIAIGPNLRELNSMVDEIKKRKEPLLDTLSKIERLRGFNIDFSSLPKKLNYQVISIKEDKLSELNTLFDDKKIKAQSLIIDDLQKDNHKLVLIATYNVGNIQELLKDYEKIDIPNVNGGPRQAKLNIEYEIARLDGKLQKLNSKLKLLSEKYYSKCVRISEALKLEEEIYRAARKFSKSKKVFYAQAWVKAKDYSRLVHTTKKLLKGKIVVEEIPPEEHKYIGCPTVLENKNHVKPFQFLVEFLSIPKHNEIDPSIILLFSVPIVFGMIVGDVGYAILNLIIAFAINKLSKKGAMLDQFTRIWMIGAIPTLIFGFLFDEYLGYSHSVFLGQTLYHAFIHRVEDVQSLLLLSISVGWISMFIGYILGAINEWNHNRMHAYAKIAWIIVQIGGTGLVSTFLLNATGMDIGIISFIIFAAGASVLLKVEGVVGLIEIPGLAANIMSYARIAAVGIAGVILAEVINSMIAPNPNSLATVDGIISFLIILLLYVLLHAINAFIAMFESFIHGARLSVLEFFGKFYHGGGLPFKPFVLKREFTVDSNIQSIDNKD